MSRSLPLCFKKEGEELTDVKSVPCPPSSSYNPAILLLLLLRANFWEINFVETSSKFVCAQTVLENESGGVGKKEGRKVFAKKSVSSSPSAGWWLADGASSFFFFFFLVPQSLVLHLGILPSPHSIGIKKSSLQGVARQQKLFFF